MADIQNGMMAVGMPPEQLDPDEEFDPTKIGMRFDGESGGSLAVTMYVYFASAEVAGNSRDALESEFSGSSDVSGDFGIQNVEQDGNRLVVDATASSFSAL